jgi:hypothetical protein
VEPANDVGQSVVHRDRDMVELAHSGQMVEISEDEVRRRRSDHPRSHPRASHGKR